MKITTPFLTFLIVTVLFLSCKKSSDDNAIPPAAVTQITTATGVLGGPKNTLITIKGSNFPTDPSKITVTINGNVCAVVSATPDAIVVKVPPYCGTGNIVININGALLGSGPVFNYEYTFGITAITNGIKDYADGPIATAKWEETSGLCVDTGNNIFTSAYTKPILRKITADLTTASTLAGDRTVGDVNGLGTAAKIGNADNISIDKNGIIYYADQSYNKIKKIDKLGNVTTFITNAVANNYPISAQVGSLGNVYVMGGDRSISKFNAAGVLQWKVNSHGISSGSIDGDSSVVKFNTISFGNAAIDNGENFLYFAVFNTGSGAASFAAQIKKLNLATLNITTITGLETLNAPTDGPAATATFKLITGLALDAGGGLFIADGYNDRIRYLKNGTVSTIIGAAGNGDVDGPPATAKIS